jgi:hypothetical protein
VSYRLVVVATLSLFPAVDPADPAGSRPPAAGGCEQDGDEGEDRQKDASHRCLSFPNTGGDAVSSGTHRLHSIGRAAGRKWRSENIDVKA